MKRKVQIMYHKNAGVISKTVLRYHDKCHGLHTRLFRCFRLQGGKRKAEAQKKLNEANKTGAGCCQ